VALRVGIDAQLTVGTPTGIGEYVTGLMRALRERGADIVEFRARGYNPWRFDRRVVWDQLLLPLQAARRAIDVLHCASGTMPLVRTKPVIVTVHDVAWMRTQGHARAYARYYFGAFSMKRYTSARHVVLDSEFSQRELMRFLPLDPARTHVVYPGVAADYCTLRRRRATIRNVVVIGTVERRKNLAVVIAALAKLPQEVRLVVAGPRTPYEDECRALASALGVDARIDWMGYILRPELLNLVAGAHVIAVPSRYEGFGYAAAQALCAGVPVVVSAGGSLQELVAGDGVCVDSDDVSGWAGALAQLLDNPEYADAHAEAVRAGAIARFSWAVAAGKMAQIYAAAKRS